MDTEEKQELVLISVACAGARYRELRGGSGSDWFPPCPPWFKPWPVQPERNRVLTEMELERATYRFIASRMAFSQMSEPSRGISFSVSFCIGTRIREKICRPMVSATPPGATPIL